jgi:hypothetical protein
MVAIRKGWRGTFFEIAPLPMIFVKFNLFLEFLYTFFFYFSWPIHKAAENFVIWPKTDHFGHFYLERYLLDDFLLIQNWI